MMPFKTEQEAFWAGAFGAEYGARNADTQLLASNIAFFSKALAHTRMCSDCVEFGANIGMNLKALKLLYPSMEQHAIEINEAAAAELAKVVPPSNIQNVSILEFDPFRTWDLVLIKGVLIHINPDWLPQAYDALYAATGRYLLVCEYYNHDPVSVTYRGHTDRLFKRDFCGDILARHSDLRLLDYGFVYQGDPVFPQDDITWFLMEKYGGYIANYPVPVSG